MSTKCFCALSHCLSGNCSCFKEDSRCSGSCECLDCQNTENNKAKVDLQYKDYLKRKSPVVTNYPVVPTGGLPVPPAGFNGCRCKRTKCTGGKCGCFAHKYRCTSKCKCQGCANTSGLGGGNTNTEPRQGGAGGVSNVPKEANIELEQTGDTSNPNKRPRKAVRRD